MKLAVVVNDKFRESLDALARQPIPLKAAFNLKGIIKRVDEEFRRWEETRNEAITRYGDKKEDGELNVDENGNVHISKEMLSDFNKQVAELANTEVDVGKIRVEDLGENVVLTTEQLLYLDPILES